MSSIQVISVPARMVFLSFQHRREERCGGLGRHGIRVQASRCVTVDLLGASVLLSLLVRCHAVPAPLDSTDVSVCSIDRRMNESPLSSIHLDA